MHYQAHNEETIREGLQKYGVAGGARVMMSNEYLHAEEAVQSGIYSTYYCPSKKIECFRAGSKSKCFCGHLFAEHNKNIGAKKINTSCLNCPCKAFKYVPTRPEECGMWWLPRRKEFDVRTWRAKCKCKHSHEEHAPTRPFRCKSCANCQDFHCDFACISCDMAWEDHEMLYETEDERRLEKKPIGKDYYPLASTQDIQEMVFDPTLANKPNPYMRPRPKDAPKLMAPKPKPALTQKPGGFGGYEETKSQEYGGFGQEKPVSKYDPDQPVMMKGVARENLVASKSGSTLGMGSRIGTTGVSKVGTTGVSKVGTTGIAKTTTTSTAKYGTSNSTSTGMIKGPVKSVPKKF